MSEDGPSSREAALAAKVLLGRISGAHGIRGEVKVTSFTAPPENIAGYGSLTDASGRRFEIARFRVIKDASLAVLFHGVADRNAAEALKGTELYVDRTQLPEPDEDEWYYRDLIGLTAWTEAGEIAGEVVALQEFGAGDLIEIRPPDRKPTLLLPFTKAAVPVVDVKAGRIVVVLPEEIDDDGDAA
jgi:16S rRNA processing protein RimM